MARWLLIHGMIMNRLTFSPRQLLSDFSKQLSERRLNRVLSRLENPRSDEDRSKAYQDLGDLIARDPHALRTYVGHQQIEGLLRRAVRDNRLLAS